MKRCNSCFKTVDREYDVCPYCGSIIESKPAEPIYLCPGTILAQRYYIGQAIGAGGFGIIYKAWDCKLETIVAIKEFFLNRIMTRAEGEREVIVNKKEAQEFEYRKERFLAEAKTMARFGTHKNIPNVFEFFEENGTAYIVMELLEGQSLSEYISENGGKVDKEFAIMIVHEIGNALSSLHEKGIIHQDVAPDNIFIATGKELKIKLLDLGAAKLADSTDEVIDIVLKPGYSPNEQYDKVKNIGPWTDVYALGATLYVALTGIKPDESTNRKIEDSVIEPKDLDGSISENLSNSIMKAMAIEKHMRFKSVSEFIKAIDGEKRIIPIKKEKKRRITRRVVGIIAAICILVVAGIGVYQYFELKRSVQVLKDANITVWFCANSESEEEKALRAIEEDFCGVFPNVTIELQCFPEEEYFDKIEEAAKNDSLPTLFESTGASNKILIKATDVSEILNSEQALSCLFLNQYDNYYANHKCIPLGFEVPVAYIVTNGNTSIDYERSTFAQLSDFGTDNSIAFDSKYKNLLLQNFSENPNASKSQFMDNDANECAVLISSSMEINEIKETLTNYEKNYIYYEAKGAKALFTYEWSIGNGNENEIEAAKRLLSWMLGNNYQNMLMVSRCSDGQLPLNKECFMNKIELKQYTPLKNVYSNYKFEKVDNGDVECDWDLIAERQKEKEENLTPVEKYVKTLYRECLGREPDEESFEYWCEQLNGGSMDAAQVGVSFVFSEEYMEMDTTDTEYIEMLYKVFMGREADKKGMKNWLDHLESGTSRVSVFSMFTASPEYKKTFEEMGIAPGTY